jgi:hypothetical protein
LLDSQPQVSIEQLLDFPSSKVGASVERLWSFDGWGAVNSIRPHY